MVDPLTIRVAERLEAIRASLGREAFRNAVDRALLGIAMAALAHAEDQAEPLGTRPRASDNLLTFPLSRARCPGEPPNHGRGL